MGFPTPLREWLRHDAGVLGSLLDRESLLAQYTDRREIESLLDRHRRGLVDATDRIWRLLNLQIWGDVFITGKKEALSC